MTRLIGILAAMLVALPLAWRARHGDDRAKPAMCLSALGLAMPGPLVAIGLIWLFNHDWEPLIAIYDRTLTVPVLALLIRVLPITLMICWHALRSIPAETIDSAATEGAGAWSRLWYVVLPQRWPALLAAMLAALALAAGDLTASILMLPAGVDSVPRRD